MDIEKITTMPCVFHPDKSINEKLWAISMIRRTSPYFSREKVLDAQHANLFVQKLENGIVNLIKLHTINRMNKDPKHLDLESKSNESIGIEIVTFETLVKAASLLMNWKRNQKLLDPVKECAGKTWLVKKDIAQQLINNFETYRQQFQQEKPSYWRFGNSTIWGSLTLAIRSSADYIGSKIYDQDAPYNALYTFITCVDQAAIAAPGMITGPIPPLLVFIIAVNTTQLITLPGYIYLLRPRTPEERVPGHSCFTWERDLLLELNIPEITNDMRSRWSDNFVAMTSLYLPSLSNPTQRSIQDI